MLYLGKYKLFSYLLTCLMHFFKEPVKVLCVPITRAQERLSIGGKGAVRVHEDTILSVK